MFEIALVMTLQAAAPLPSCGSPPRGSLPWVTESDYPPQARRRGQEGDVAFELAISAEGCPVGCTIIASSGFPVLDDATCKLMLERARFRPRQDAAGQPIEATWRNTFRWRL